MNEETEVDDAIEKGEKAKENEPSSTFVQDEVAASHNPPPRPGETHNDVLQKEDSK